MKKRATYRAAADSEFTMSPKGMRIPPLGASATILEMANRSVGNRFAHPRINARMLPESDWDPVSATPTATGSRPGSGIPPEDTPDDKRHPIPGSGTR